MEKVTKKIRTQTAFLLMAGIILFPVIAFGEMDIRYTEDGFKIVNNNQRLKVNGTLMWDVDSLRCVFFDFERDDTAWHTRSELRRARLNFEAEMSDNWKAGLQLK